MDKLNSKFYAKVVMVSPPIDREYIPAYGADHDAVKHGLAWLLSGDDETLALFVPTLRQIGGSISTVLTTVLGEETAKQFVKDGRLNVNGKIINLITEKKTVYLEEPVRLLACWADSKSIEKLEVNYRISHLLVITWNSKHDITDWKLRKRPKQFTGYIPPQPPEGEY